MNMNNKIFFVCFGFGLIMLGFNIPSQAATAVTVNYGVVKSVSTTTKDAQHAGGALAGGIIGGLIGPRRHRGLRVVAGAGIGAAVQGSATSGVLQQYTVELVSGGQSIISTEQTDIMSGDCVMIEQGDHANIRRVSSYHCETKNKTTAEHHQSAADNCQLAKNELTKAETDQAITNAAKKVRILCED
jgi:outer membrane lipoprotein SlyB